MLSLDALRGGAALAVVTYHALGVAPQTAFNGWEYWLPQIASGLVHFAFAGIYLSLSSPAFASTCSGLKHAQPVWTNLASTFPISGNGAFEGYTLRTFWLLLCICVTWHTRPPFM